MDTIAQYIKDVLNRWVDSKMQNSLQNHHESSSKVQVWQDEAIHDNMSCELHHMAIVRLYNEKATYKGKLGIETVEHGTLKIKYDKLKAENELLQTKWYVKLSNRLQDIKLPKVSIKW